MGETMGFRLLAVISGSPVYFFDGAFRNWIERDGLYGFTLIIIYARVLLVGIRSVKFEQVFIATKRTNLSRLLD